MQSEDREIIRFVSEYGFPVIALHEESGVYINQNILMVIGEAPVTLFSHKQKIVLKVGSTYNL